MEKIKIESKGNIMKGESETVRCNHCFEKFTYKYEDIKRTSDERYGIMRTVRCPKCKMLITIK